MRQRRARNTSAAVKDAAVAGKSEKIYKIAPIMTLATDGSTIYGRLNAETLQTGLFKSYAPVAKLVPNVPYLDTDGSTKYGYDVQDAAGNSFLDYPQETAHKAVLYSSRKFVSSEVSRLFPVDSDKQSLRSQLDTAATLKLVLKALIRSDYAQVTSEMLEAVKADLEVEERVRIADGIAAYAKAHPAAAQAAKANNKK